MSHIQTKLANEDKYVVIPNYVRASALYHRTCCLYEKFRYGTGPYDDVLDDPNNVLTHDRVDGYSLPDLGILPTLLARDSILLEMMHRIDYKLIFRIIHQYKKLQDNSDKTTAFSKKLRSQIKQMDHELKWFENTVSAMERDMKYIPQTLIWGKQVSEIQTYMDKFECLKTITGNLQNLVDCQTMLTDEYTNEIRSIHDSLENMKDGVMTQLRSGIKAYEREYFHNDKSKEKEMNKEQQDKREKERKKCLRYCKEKVDFWTYEVGMVMIDIKKMIIALNEELSVADTEDGMYDHADTEDGVHNHAGGPDELLEHQMAMRQRIAAGWDQS
eukprot:499553-Rhodomonas_salina.1